MNNTILHNNIIDSLRYRYPKKSELTRMLVDMLSLDKKAAYRRINGEVPFSFEEIAIICNKLKLSLDNIVASEPIRSRPSSLRMTELYEPTESDYQAVEDFISFLWKIKDDNNTELVETTNLLPKQFYLMHEHITKFYFFKWRYLNKTNQRTLSYKETQIPSKTRSLLVESMLTARHLKSTDFILDKMVFSFLVNDIKYFRKVGLITKEEVTLIKNDILKILETWETLTRTGVFPETGNKINIYVSNINIFSNHSYINTDSFGVIILKIFIMNNIRSIDNNSFSKSKDFIQSSKRQSVLISRCNESERISFLKKQKEIISSL